MVSGSRARLARAVGNLLDNAVKWGPAGAPVEVSVSAGEVVVRDHGPGIAQDDLPHVFDRFYRAPAARGLPGSGLGLAIVKHVADAHRGTVVAEPAPGGGTCLRLALPLLQTS
jgi:two-component system, OmpR family, sensor histidine kinase MprB